MSNLIHIYIPSQTSHQEQVIHISDVSEKIRHKIIHLKEEGEIQRKIVEKWEFPKLEYRNDSKV